MAVAAAEAQATVTEKITIGKGRAIYVGTLAFGNEYRTGGDEIGTSVTSRFKLPEKLDWVQVGAAAGHPVEFVRPNLLKLYAQNKAEGETLKEVASKVDLSAIIATSFMAIGIA